MIEEIMESTAFWILCGVGVGALTLMLIVLNKMGNSDIMPFWVKIVSYLSVPIVAAIFSGFAEG